jgi:hypothetical protein
MGSFSLDSPRNQIFSPNFSRLDDFVTLLERIEFCYPRPLKTLVMMTNILKQALTPVREGVRMHRKIRSVEKTTT